MIRNEKFVLTMLIASFVLFVLTPAINHAVCMQRGYQAYGGECILWLFPLLALGFRK